MTTRLDPGIRPDLWEGAVAWEPGEQWWQAWRLRPELGARSYAPELLERAQQTAGVRLRVRTDAGTLTAELDAAPDAEGVVDLLTDGALAERVVVTPGVNRLAFALPTGCTDVELWLPQAAKVRVGRVTLGDGIIASPPTAPTTRWIAYGSSITQCKASPGPSETWPALVARGLGWNLTCMGFGAECHLDPIVVRSMAGLPADVITLCLGINVYGRASFGPRAWAGQTADFILRVREAHPKAAIVVISPIGCPDREQTPNAARMSLRDIRDDVERVAADLRAGGDTRITPLSGLDVLSVGESDLLIDGLHPGPDGYRLMAQRIGRVLGSLPTPD